MYDLPPSLPSPSSSSFVQSSTKMSRSNSPIPHISTLIPHHHHHHHHHSHHHSQYSPNSRAADITRLLDPTYASHNSSSSGSSSRSASQPLQTRAYVDHHGDLHDPDYRDFPVLPTRPKSNAPRRRHTASSAQLLHHHHSASRLPASPARTDRYSTYPLVARPEWERDWATEIEDLDEDDEEELVDLSSPFVRTSSSHTTPSSRRASLPPSIYAHSTFFYNEPVSMTSSPVDSLEEQEEGGLGLSESPFEDLGAEEFVEEETASTSKGRASSLLRRMKRSGSQCSVPPVIEAPAPPPPSIVAPPVPKEEMELELEEHAEEPHPVPSIEFDEDDDVSVPPSRRRRAHADADAPSDDRPSCTHVLRQQWRAVALRLRFGVFHVQRRLATPRRKTM
ncbi:hypothetical protein EIP86_010858 [Pleurotus ostreatoroseus]|nr:hypothetical protein EIP86_010858 [Pleurotus ostreatoroseus]